MNERVKKLVDWKLQDLNILDYAPTVFSCFSCCGGSTMGYKKAGFKVLGCCEIDKEMVDIYIKNHKPKYPFHMSVADFYKQDRAKIPKELFELDILDGSPPCSSFSMASTKRKEKWGTKKHFREGQAAQNLDDLFFEYIKVAEFLKPKFVVAENVVGLLRGEAKGYVKQIFTDFRNAGYEPQLFKLNSIHMNVPQARNRVFFIAQRKDLALPKIKLSFDYPKITFGDIYCKEDTREDDYLARDSKYYFCCKNYKSCDFNMGDTFERIQLKRSLFNYEYITLNKVSTTLTASTSKYYVPELRRVNRTEIRRIQTFPIDFDFQTESYSKINYILGMSVPPNMMECIANEIKNQWINKL